MQGLGAGEVMESIIAATRLFSEWPVGPYATSQSFARSPSGILQSLKADDHPGHRWVGMHDPPVPLQHDSGQGHSGQLLGLLFSVGAKLWGVGLSLGLQHCACTDLLTAVAVSSMCWNEDSLCDASWMQWRALQSWHSPEDLDYASYICICGARWTQEIPVQW